MELRLRGETVYAYTGGKPFDAQLPCIVFLHGALHDHSVWTLLARWFAHHGHAVLAFDQPGHRRSTGPLLPDIETIADWALECLDHLGVKQAAWVGHSMGSLIALEAAAKAHERASRLVMLGTAYPMQVSPQLLQAAEFEPAECIRLINALSFSNLAIKPGVPGPGTWAHGANRALMALVQQGSAPGALLHDLQLCHRYSGAMTALEAVKCEVDMVLGEHDQMTHRKSALVLAEKLQATVHTLQSGHALMQEQPDGVLNILKRALA
jgi:pimeloyl-ACP methyl ester carboxylesterase